MIQVKKIRKLEDSSARLIILPAWNESRFGHLAKGYICKQKDSPDRGVLFRFSIAERWNGSPRNTAMYLFNSATL